MLRVEEALATRVAHVQSLEVVGAAPVVVIDHERRLVPERAALLQPPVAELVVLGRLLRAEPLVEPAELEHGGAWEHHVVPEQPAAATLAAQVARRRVVLRRRHGAGIADR